MKRWLPILLVTALLLAGCQAGTTDPAGTQTVPDDAPGATGAYVADSTVEQATNGAVKAYRMDTQESYTDLYPVEGGVLLLSDTAQLSLLSADQGQWKKSIHDVDAIISVSEQTLYYYMESTKTVYAMNPATLEPLAVHTLPQAPDSMPVVGEQTGEIYYCTAGEIRALRLDSGLSRMIKQHSYDQQRLIGSYFGGDVLGWENPDGIHFLSSANGSTLASNTGIYALQNRGEIFLAGRQDGKVNQKIYGVRQDHMQQLNIPESGFCPSISENKAIGWEETTDGLVLAVYDMQTGTCTSRITVPGVADVTCVRALAGQVWVLAQKEMYCWNTAASVCEDATVYLGVLHTSDNPNEEGIAQCRERAQTLSEQYNVRILVWDEAVAETQGRTIVGEHQPENIDAMLDQLEEALAQAPKLLVDNTVKKGRIRICLVRSIDGHQPYGWYWADGYYYIAIATGSNVREAFLTGLGCAVDTKILGNSRDLEFWNSMNPEGFDYTYDYVLNEKREMPERYIGSFFTDLRAMSFPTEDRARIFCYALTEGNAELFQKDMLQNKLRTLCEGIREAYDLQTSKEEYPWEQYLNNSLAP